MTSPSPADDVAGLIQQYGPPSPVERWMREAAAALSRLQARLDKFQTEGCELACPRLTNMASAHSKAVREHREASATAGEVGWRPTHRHVKSGGLYQATGTRINATNTASGQIMVDYQDERGQKFCREQHEFEDGRFEAIPSPTGGDKP
jgi:hypothetical protein